MKYIVAFKDANKYTLNGQLEVKSKKEVINLFKEFTMSGIVAVYKQFNNDKVKDVTLEMKYDYIELTNWKYE